MKIASKDLFLSRNIEEYKIKLELFKEIYVDNNSILMMPNRHQKEIEKYYEYLQDLIRYHLKLEEAIVKKEWLELISGYTIINIKKN